MGEQRLVKSNFICTVTTVEPITNEDGTTSYKVKESKNEKWRGKEFYDSMYADYDKGIEHKIVVVNQKPEQFQLNAIYILADGTRMWIWVDEKDMIQEAETEE